MTDLGVLTSSRSIVVCCGTGGVGKTTTAATVALEGARQGRRAVVVTIDPAKRLADALGAAGSLSNTPSRIDGDWPGELWAVMLDTKSTFDELVHRYSADPEQAARILANRFYRNMSTALSGTQEYMAAEKLYELHDDLHFDLVVVDTPPTHNALDFLDAPGRLTRFLDHRLYRVLMAPTRAYLRAVNAAARTVLRSMTKVVGAEVISDAIAFFQAFDGMEAGFRERAGRVLELLGAADTAYVLVAAPRADAVEEAMYFAKRLADSGMSVAALVVNRVHPTFGSGTAAERGRCRGRARRYRPRRAVGEPGRISRRRRAKASSSCRCAPRSATPSCVSCRSSPTTSTTSPDWQPWVGTCSAGNLPPCRTSSSPPTPTG